VKKDIILAMDYLDQDEKFAKCDFILNIAKLGQLQVEDD